MDSKDLLENVHQLSIAYDSKDDVTRRKLLRATQKLMLSLETPAEATLRIAWVQNATQTTIRVATDLDIFRHISEKQATSEELANTTGAERSLITRLMNQLSAVGVVAQPSPDVFAATPLTEALKDPIYSSAVPAMAAAMSRALQALPDVFKTKGYKEPVDGLNCGFQPGLNTELHFFDYFTANTEVAALFNNHMLGYALARGGHWVEFYPVKERLAPGLEVGENATLLVDLGGGLGRDVLGFKEKFTDLKGRLVVQDIGSVAQSWKGGDGIKDDNIEFMEHDFFNEQPIKGARAYYMHSVLHDWSDSRCHAILSALKPALKAGYSKVLIHENVIPSDPEKLHEIPTSLDWILMASLASRERTEQEWTALLREAGFRIDGIWTGHIGGESVIEAVPVED